MDEEIEMAPVTTIVEAINLKKTYMLAKVPVKALDDVNLRVDSGDFLAVLGLSGSGQSTLLNLIGALDKPWTNQRKTSCSSRALTFPHSMTTC